MALFLVVLCFSFVAGSIFAICTIRIQVYMTCTKYMQSKSKREVYD